MDHVVAADQGAERRLQVVLAQHVVDACRPTAGDQRQGHVQPTQLADHRGDAGQQGTVGAFLQRIDPLLEDPPALHRQVAEQIVQGVAARTTVHVVAQAVRAERHALFAGNPAPGRGDGFAGADQDAVHVKQNG